MISNLNKIDRTLRIIIGLGLLSLVFIGPQTAWGYLGIVLIITGFISFCPMYRVIGLSTCKQSGHDKSSSKK